jgi:NAD(P)-dependent dehydrogenase (short-subunit alcohol dehydrogenase family)
MGSRPAALVTGAALRVGQAIALRLAREGYDILAHYHTSGEAARALAREIHAAGGSARLIQTDLAQPGASRRLAEEALRASGELRLLVNNASVWERQPLAALQEPEVERCLRVNLLAPFLLSSALGIAMREAGGGAIVNLLDWSIERPYPDYLPYTIAKAGLASATRGLARALAPEVRINGIAPGPVLLHPGATSEEHESVRRSVPLARLGSPEEVADAVVFLASARFVTGTILTLDGGRSLR